MCVGVFQTSLLIFRCNATIAGCLWGLPLQKCSKAAEGMSLGEWTTLYYYYLTVAAVTVITNIALWVSGVRIHTTFQYKHKRNVDKVIHWHIFTQLSINHTEIKGNVWSKGRAAAAGRYESHYVLYGCLKSRRKTEECWLLVSAWCNVQFVRRNVPPIQHISH